MTGRRLRTCLTLAVPLSILVGAVWLLPDGTLALASALVVAVGLGLLLPRRFPGAFERAYCWRVSTPVWLLGAVVAAGGLVGWLVRTGAVTPVGVASAVGVGVCGTALLATVFERRVPALASRHPVSLWFASVAAFVVAIGVVAVHSTGSPETGLYLFGLVFVLFYLEFVVPVSLVQRADESPAPTSYPTVSVLIPAHNEAGYVGRCIEHVLATTYPADRLEVVVVDDGSTDGTYEEACEYRSDRVNVFTRPNGGKHGALNFGLLCASGDIIVTLDADSFVAPESLTATVAAFEDEPGVGAVASDVRVLNQRGVLPRLQALEYLLGINTFRRAYAYFGAVALVPGCLGAFRREALAATGGFDGDTLAEDFDTTVQVLKAGWKVRQSEATVWTEVPFTWRDFYRQRLRWSQGNLQTMLKHLDALGDDSSGYFHRFVFPFRLLTVLFVPLASVGIVLALAQAASSGTTGSLFAMLAFVLVAMTAVTGLVVVLAGESLALVPLAPLLVVGYTPVLSVVLLVSLVAVARGRDREWRRVVRQSHAAD